MNAIQRRLWIAGVGLVASILILAGLLVGAFRIAVQLVPEYRAEVEHRVAELIGSPVRIQRMDLIWRGRYPTLQLRDLEVGAHASRRLSLQELSLGFAITRLVRGDWYPAQVILRGSQLQLIRENGEFRLAGVSPRQADTSGQSLPQFLSQLRRIASIRWYQSSLRLHDRDAGQEPVDIIIEELSTRRRTGGLYMELQAYLAREPARRVDLELQLAAEPWMIETLELEAEQLLPGPYISAYFPQAPAVDGELTELKLSANWDNGAWRDGELEFALRDLAPMQQPVAVERVLGRATLDRPGDTGIRASVQIEDMQTSTGSWPSQSLLLHWQNTDQAPAYSLNMEYLNLAAVQAWYALLPEKLITAMMAMSPDGELRRIVVQSLPGHDVPRISAELSELTFNAYEQIPGVRNLSGEFSFSAGEARLQLDSNNIEITAPLIFERSLSWDELSGGVRWSRQSDGWQLDAPGLHYAAMNLDGVGRLSLRKAESLSMDLNLNFFCSDPRPWLDYQPLIWHPRLRTWLSEAVEGAQVASGQVRIQGDMQQFPFPDRVGGEFTVDLDLREASLAFAPDWPAVKVDQARLLIDGRTLSVDAVAAQIGAMNASTATAVIPDLRQSVLDIDARVAGDAKEAWRILAESNLRQELGQLFDSIDLSGSIAGDLKLILPLDDLKELSYAVDVELDRAALWTRYWPDPVQKISGKLHIDEQGLRGRELQAAMAGIPMQVDLTPKNGFTNAEAKFSASLAQLSASVPIPKFIVTRAQGQADWRLNLQFGGKSEPKLLAHSPLLGMSLDLPEPFAKEADQLRAFDLRVEPVKSVRVHLNYGGQLGLDMLLDDQAGPQAARLRIGGDALAAGAPGWWVEGQLERAEFSQWLPLLQDVVSELSSYDNAGSSSFGGLVVKLGQLNALGQRWPDTRLQLTQTPAAWRLALAGPRANGILRFPAVDKGERTRVIADFEQMNWTRAVELDSGGEMIDPRLVPALQLNAKAFAVNDISLGELNLNLEPVRDGLRIATATVNAGERRELDLSGIWLRDKSGSSAAMELDMDSRNFSSWLSVLGYQDNLRADEARVSARLNWAANLEGLQSSSLSGDLGFAFENGQLLNIEPGAGRVLGLFSVNALPRRFFLDFSDVVRTGLGFDQLSGDFSLASGLAQTQNLEMEGPSLRMVARGSVDLVGRSYDQIITIYPGISSGVSLAATLLGGPVLGLFAVLAQELLDQPLDQVTQFGYHLGGSWDNPQVSRLQ